MDVMCMSLSVDMTDNEIKDCIQQSLPVCNAKEQGFFLSIDGYDDDRRELWQIPEVVKFMKRLCDFGFIAILEASTTCSVLIRKEYKKFKKLPGIGALEVWMFATGRMEKMIKENNSIDTKTMNEFSNFLITSIDFAKAISKETSYHTGNYKYKTQQKQRTQIPDAPVKHHGFNRIRKFR